MGTNQLTTHARLLAAGLAALLTSALPAHELPSAPAADSPPAPPADDSHGLFEPIEGAHGLLDHLRPITDTITDTITMPLRPLDPLLDPLLDPIIPILSIPDLEDGYLTFYYDNDLFGGTDENYTNGMRLSWISMNRELEDLTFVQRKLAKFSGLDNGDRYFYNYGFSLTHFMFTPEDILATEPIPGQRPYAGWFGVGFSLHAKNEKVLNSLELNLGIVGPNSLAENAQDFIHNLRDIDTAKGWGNQLPSEFTANIFFTQKRSLFEPILIGDWLELEGIHHWGFGVGNLNTDFRAGALARFGYNLPLDFSPSKLDVTGYTHQLFLEKGALPGPWSVYGTLAVEGRATAFDVFLDGTSFSDSPSVDKAGVTGDITLGFGLRYKKFSLNYSETFRTKEYRSQEDNQVYGSFQISYAF